MKQLILLRGLPGSGKSTLAKQLSKGSGEGMVEADQYFTDSNGNYNFDASKLKEAHQWCQDQVDIMMRVGYPRFSLPDYLNEPLEKIVVSNTFTQEWEMKPYYELAEKYGYTVFSLVVENRHGGVNTHGVPDETLDKMENRFTLKLR